MYFYGFIKLITRAYKLILWFTWFMYFILSCSYKVSYLVVVHNIITTINSRCDPFRYNRSFNTLTVWFSIDIIQMYQIIDHIVRNIIYHFFCISNLVKISQLWSFSMGKCQTLTLKMQDSSWQKLLKRSQIQSC